MRRTKQKNKNIFRLLCGILIIVFAFLIGRTHAIRAEENQPFSESRQAGLINCFQYYNFGSVDIRIDPSKYTYQPGEVMTFKGTLENKNNYPVVDGEVYVKIYRRDPGFENAQNGDFQVAEFKALKGISIGSQAKREVSFSYVLPHGLASGEYLAQFFFEVSGKYNLAGLSFHSSMPGSITSFAVKGVGGEAVYFDKDNAKINDNPYGFRQVPKPEQSGKDIVVLAPLRNSTSETVDVQIEKDIFFWDALEEKNKVDSSSEQISIAPNSGKDISYTIKNPKYSVYLVRFTAKSSAGQAVIGIRPTIEGIFQPRLNFPALASFPLKSGQKSVLFTCFHNAGLDRKTGKLVLDLKDDKGNVIAEHTYGGDIPGEMTGTAREFTPEENYDKVTLSAGLYNDKGELVDSSVQNYDCGRFDPPICGIAPEQPAGPVAVSLPPEEPFATTSPLFWLVDYRGGKIILEIFTGISLLVLAGLVVRKTVAGKKTDEISLKS